MKYHKRLPWLKALCSHEQGFEYVGAVKTQAIEGRLILIIDVDAYVCSFCGKAKLYGIFKSKAMCFQPDQILQETEKP
jgi:hypothetical protein